MIKVDYIHHVGDEITIVNAARVSFDNESEWVEGRDVDLGTWSGPIPTLNERDKRLIKYLIKHNHHSPFNHCFLTFRVTAPVFVARQLVKHKFMPWNEISRRYVDDEPELYTPTQWRKRADNKKQGSSDEVVDMSKHPQHDVLYEVCNLNDMIDSHKRWSLDLYDDLLEAGVAPEQARMVLPQSMLTSWYWSGTLGAFLDMLKLRLKPDTQHETREVATLISHTVRELFPVTYEAVLGENH